MDFKTVLASAAASAVVVAVGVPTVVNFVTLQPTTPGTTETGHSHISGYSLASRFGAGVSPTIARIQVEESGGIQGVRASTGTGVSIYGQSNALTGLGAGGYFTSKSVGGRGLVADALSSTGSTVGGLFYNHSNSTNAVGVWGRILGTGAAGTGVFANSATTDGTALRAVHDPSGNGLISGSSTDSLRTTGVMPRHAYQNGLTSPMIPIAYGQVSGSSTVSDPGSGNWTVSNTGVGACDIDVVGFNPNTVNSTIIATAQEAGKFQGCTSDTPAVSGDFAIKTWNDASVAESTDFAFIVYMGVPATPMPMPDELQNPPQLKKYGNDEVWAKKDFRGYMAWNQKRLAWLRSQLIQSDAVKNAPRP